MDINKGRTLVKCIYIQQKPKGPAQGDLKVYMPELMKKWGPDVPKVTPVPLVDSCFNSSSECKPIVSKKINTQNFATAKAPMVKYKSAEHLFGAELECWPGTSDVLTPRLTTENVDPSSGSLVCHCPNAGTCSIGKVCFENQYTCPYC